MINITFDSSNPAWVNDATSNRFFIMMTISRLMELLSHREYLYLNQIYEHFGVKWNPNFENVCYKGVDELIIEYGRAGENGYLITIN